MSSTSHLPTNPRHPLHHNLGSDVAQSKVAIHSELKAKIGGEFVVICSQRNFSFIADWSNYCVDGSAAQTCYVFQI
ncbi:unnamed protein product [Toxocara canis]|uniref:Ground-like domain-containing protein n=1 Tax=Toxocara canis TaxID=6265 RepID=A0A183UNA4_TOXCA|nr:unnamed protein product [Toxocara canis]